jgi:hypothetical protein
MKKQLKAFNNEKVNAEKKIKIGGVVAIAGAAIFVLLGMSGVSAIGFVGLPMLVFGVIYLGLGSAAFAKLSQRFKTEVLTDLIASFVDDGKFIPEQGLSLDTIYATEFLQRADRHHTEDYLSGSIDGVRFESSDVKLEEKHVEHTKNGTRTYYETYFLGRIFVFDFNKSFDGYLQVLERGRPVSKRKFNKVKLESIQFNKKFKTYTTNDHSAFYVLTPHFMEALMTFEQNNKGNISFSFIDTRLYIGINNFRDTFELKMFKELNMATFKEFERELGVVKEVISELKLNRNIYK